MTLKELIIGNHRICSLEADIRDYRDGKAQLIKSYHIGLLETPDRYADPEHGIEPRWETINKAINFKDIGKDYWGVIAKNIPKSLLDMDVKAWDLWDGWRSNNGLNKHMKLKCDLEGKDNAIVIESKEDTEQLKGQMCFEEYFERLKEVNVD